MTDASAMLIEAYFTALCTNNHAAAENQFGPRCFVVDFDKLCDGDETSYNTLADAVQVPREHLTRVTNGCPPKDYPVEDVLVAESFFAGRTHLYPHAASPPQTSIGGTGV